MGSVRMWSVAEGRGREGCFDIVEGGAENDKLGRFTEEWRALLCSLLWGLSYGAGFGNGYGCDGCEQGRYPMN